MNYNKWYKGIKEHLANYKTNVLHINENGIFSNNKKEYAHIIPEEKGVANYLCASFNELDFKKHGDWYHMNSSQTLCVNFFAILDNNDLSKLMSRILKKEVIVEFSKFEFTPVKSSSNFDFYVRDSKGNNYYCEAKYTEKHFDPKSKAKDKHATYKKLYKDEVENNPFFKNITEDSFINEHYQAYRNMVKGKGEDYSLFLTMKSNESTHHDIESAVDALKISRVKTVNDLPNVKSLYWEELINDVIELFNNRPELVSYYKRFKEKYIPPFTED